MARHAVVQESLCNKTRMKYGFVMHSNLTPLKAMESNRRMRKTARPVVWEP